MLEQDKIILQTQLLFQRPPESGIAQRNLIFVPRFKNASLEKTLRESMFRKTQPVAISILQNSWKKSSEAVFPYPASPIT